MSKPSVNHAYARSSRGGALALLAPEGARHVAALELRGLRLLRARDVEGAAEHSSAVVSASTLWLRTIGALQAEPRSRELPRE